jgi:hypothetical protein
VYICFISSNKYNRFLNPAKFFYSLAQSSKTALNRAGQGLAEIGIHNVMTL